MTKQSLFTLFFLVGTFFGFNTLQAASVSGFVWDDQNTNGIQDAGEPGMANIWVSVYLGADVYAVILTDANGNYSFSDLPDGTYHLKFSNPGGLWQSLQDIGGNDALDSDADPFGFTTTFALAGNAALDYDAGFTTTPTGCFTPITLEVSAIACNDNGTPGDPSDDTFTFVITATGGTGEWGWDALPDILMAPYGVPYTFGPFPVSGGPVTIDINDHDNPFCTATVTVDPPSCGPSPQPEPCDELVVGCVTYELLSITQDASNKRTYNIRVTNNCANPLIYAAFQLPNGITASAPANGSTYTAPSGRTYEVRNPNHSPFYSVRFKAVGTGISNGQSDIFSYTLPGYSNPTYILSVVRVAPKVFYEGYLNTFNCIPLDADGGDSGETTVTPEDVTNPVVLAKPTTSTGLFTVFPNPSEGSLFADLSPWNGQTVRLSVLNAQGQQVYQRAVTADATPQALELGDLPAGLYHLRVVPSEGASETRQFMLKH